MIRGFVAPFPAGESRWQIAPIPVAFPRWSRDGKRLFFKSYGDLYEVDVTLQPSFSVGVPRKLFTPAPLHAGTENPAGFDVSADGKRFLIIDPDRTVPQPSVAVVINFTP